MCLMEKTKANGEIKTQTVGSKRPSLFTDCLPGSALTSCTYHASSVLGGIVLCSHHIIQTIDKRPRGKKNIQINL